MEWSRGSGIPAGTALSVICAAPKRDMVHVLQLGSRCQFLSIQAVCTLKTAARNKARKHTVWQKTTYWPAR